MHNSPSPHRRLNSSTALRAGIELDDYSLTSRPFRLAVSRQIGKQMGCQRSREVRFWHAFCDELAPMRVDVVILDPGAQLAQYLDRLLRKLKFAIVWAKSVTCWRSSAMPRRGCSSCRIG